MQQINIQVSNSEIPSFTFQKYGFPVLLDLILGPTQNWNLCILLVTQWRGKNGIQDLQFKPPKSLRYSGNNEISHAIGGSPPPGFPSQIPRVLRFPAWSASTLPAKGWALVWRGSAWACWVPGARACPRASWHQRRWGSGPPWRYPTVWWSPSSAKAPSR